MLDITDIVIPQYKEQGFTLEEEGDHILILRHHDKEIGRFSVPGVRIAEIVETIEGEATKSGLGGEVLT